MEIAALRARVAELGATLEAKGAEFESFKMGAKVHMHVARRASCWTGDRSPAAADRGQEPCCLHAPTQLMHN